MNIVLVYSSFELMHTSTSLLQSHSLRKTAFRLRLLELFMDSPHSAKSNALLEAKLGEHDRITLYRTLKSFEKSGLIHQVVDSSNEMKYALCHQDCEVHKTQTDHPHFHCETCGETFCLEGVQEIDLTLPKNYTVEKITLTVTGVCAECR